MNAQNNQPKSKQFYWKIEDLWEKYYEKTEEKISNFFDFTPSQTPVFFDDNENNKPYFGLKNDAQIINKNKKEIFLTDNHHKVFSFLFDQFLKNKEKIILIHIDAHRDNAIFQNYEKCKIEIDEVKIFLKNIENMGEKYFLENVEKIKNNINIIQNNCRISDYLDIALHLGFVEKIISVTQTSEFQNELKYFENKGVIENETKTKNIILNLDIDIYGPEGEAVSVDLKTEVIAKNWKGANAVCIATSPAFIHEDVAEKIISIFV